eukprot:365965-Chlamydomonas_euryale.AAC.8
MQHMQQLSHLCEAHRRMRPSAGSHSTPASLRLNAFVTISHSYRFNLQSYRSTGAFRGFAAPVAGPWGLGASAMDVPTIESIDGEVFPIEKARKMARRCECEAGRGPDGGAPTPRWREPRDTVGNDCTRPAANDFSGENVANDDVLVKCRF